MEKELGLLLESCPVNGVRINRVSVFSVDYERQINFLQTRNILQAHCKQGHIFWEIRLCIEMFLIAKVLRTTKTRIKSAFRGTEAPQVGPKY